MDDGSFKGGYFSLATCCFTINEHELFRKIFAEKFNIKITIYLKGNFFTIAMPAKDEANKKFKLLVDTI
jgi:hypothetical protein